MRAMLVAALVTGLVGLSGKAEDKKSDPTGTWKWEVERNGQKREQTLKLKLDGDKLTGSMPGRNNTETKIEDGKFKDGEATFTITREFNEMKFVTKYKVKVEGETLKGTAETERDGKAEKREFEAKRTKDEKKDN